jgi:hypothetical protein
MGKASHSSQLSRVETFVNRGGLKLRNELLSFYHSQVYIEQDQQALVQRTDVVNPGLQYRCDSSIKYIDNILDCNKYEFARLKPNCYGRLAVVSDVDDGGFALNVDKELRGSAMLYRSKYNRAMLGSRWT